MSDGYVINLLADTHQRGISHWPQSPMVMIGTDQRAVSLSIPFVPLVREVQLTVPSIEALDMTLHFLYTGELAPSAASPGVFFGLMHNAEYLLSESLTTACLELIRALRWPSALTTDKRFCTELVPYSFIIAALKDDQPIEVVLEWLKDRPPVLIEELWPLVKKARDKAIMAQGMEHLRNLAGRFPSSFDMVFTGSRMLSMLDNQKTQKCLDCDGLVLYRLRNERTCKKDFHRGEYTPNVGWSCCKQFLKKTKGCDYHWGMHEVYRGWDDPQDSLDS